MVSALRIIIERSYYYQLVETAWNGECFLCFHDIPNCNLFDTILGILQHFCAVWNCMVMLMLFDRRATC